MSVSDRSVLCPIVTSGSGIGMMPVDDIIPSKDALEAKEAVKMAMEQQAAMAGQGPQQVQVTHSGGGDQAQATQPDGSPMGGQADNTASNKLTGRGGA